MSIKEFDPAKVSIRGMNEGDLEAITAIDCMYFGVERPAYYKDWKQRTGNKMVGFFCTYAPEEIFYAFDVLPVRVLGSHEIQDVTEPHIFAMFCPYCRDVLAQGLRGKYDYLDGVTIGGSCLHLRQAFTSWDIHRNPGWSHYLPMPSHVQSPRASR